MADKFQNKYRIPSARWNAWDYSTDGLYFITICTVNRECLFGAITNKELTLSNLGRIVVDEWEKSFEIRHELFCDAFAIMPNHIHAILCIDNKNEIVETHGRASEDMPNEDTHGFDVDKHDLNVETHNINVDTHNINVDTHNINVDTHNINVETHNINVETHNINVETHGRASLRWRTLVRNDSSTGIPYREPKSISSFVAGFKSAVTSRINQIRQTKGMPVWQTRFHDHVIRNDDEYKRIRFYIDTNVENWEKDMFFN